MCWKWMGLMKYKDACCVCGVACDVGGVRRRVEENGMG